MKSGGYPENEKDIAGPMNCRSHIVSCKLALISLLLVGPAVIASETNDDLELLGLVSAERQLTDTQPRKTSPLVSKSIADISLSALQTKLSPPLDRFAQDNVVRITDLESRDFLTSHFYWRASGLCHNPLYFEDVSLERYGHVNRLQPAFSGLRFFASAPLLPYKLGVDAPHDKIYSLGYERPGKCATPVSERLPLRRKAALLQLGAVTGFVFLFP